MVQDILVIVEVAHEAIQAGVVEAHEGDLVNVEGFHEAIQAGVGEAHEGDQVNAEGFHVAILGGVAVFRVDILVNVEEFLVDFYEDHFELLRADRFWMLQLNIFSKITHKRFLFPYQVYHQDALSIASLQPSRT